MEYCRYFKKIPSQNPFYILAGIPSLWILENNHDVERLYLRQGFVPTGNRNHITGKLDEVEFISKEFERGWT